MPPFVLDRGDPAESRVAPAGVIEALDELEDRHPSLRVAAEGTAPQQLRFERREEALGHGVVVRIAD